MFCIVPNNTLALCYQADKSDIHWQKLTNTYYPILPTIKTLIYEY